MTQFESFKTWIRSLVGTKKETWYARYLKYTREITIALLFAAILVGGFVGYRWYRSTQEDAAQLLFAEGMELYQQANAGSVQWPQVELFFNLGYERHKNSKLAPYFLAFKADALSQQKKNNEAISALSQAIDQMNAKVPFKTMYQTKLALLQMDNTDATMQEKGLQSLKALAEDTANKESDVAQYYLGLYYWTQNDMTQARTIWQQLISSQMSEQHAMSPWAAMAEEKLSHLPNPAPVKTAQS